ncbi:MAG: hypothetical protein ACR2LJ_12545 [Acidimicrobiales bacterium]
MLVQHRPAGVDPALVQAPQRIRLAKVSAIGQPGGTIDLECRQPTLQRAHPDPELVGL